MRRFGPPLLSWATPNTIRLRILKAWLCSTRAKIWSGYTQHDPTEDTESWHGPGAVYTGAKATPNTIRLRILKAPDIVDHCVGRVAATPNTIRLRILKGGWGTLLPPAQGGYTQHDPTEDTESLRPRKCDSTQRCYTQHDPTEDTERPSRGQAGATSARLHPTRSD